MGMQSIPDLNPICVRSYVGCNTSGATEAAKRGASAQHYLERC